MDEQVVAAHANDDLVSLQCSYKATHVGFLYVESLRKFQDGGSGEPGLLVRMRDCRKSVAFRVRSRSTSVVNGDCLVTELDLLLMDEGVDHEVKDGMTEGRLAAQLGGLHLLASLKAGSDFVSGYEKSFAAQKQIVRNEMDVSGLDGWADPKSNCSEGQAGFGGERVKSDSAGVAPCYAE